MAKQDFLVTGASGATGGGTVRLLRERGLPVRALVHGEDARAEALRKIGAEVVVGELTDLESVRAALRGTRRAYFIYPIRPGILQATAYFAQAAREEKLEAIVNMSQISARSDAASHAAQNHWVAERLFDWSGVPSTHLRPTLFAEWLLYWAAFLRAGTWRLPMGNGRHAPLASADQARLITEILVAPEAHAGKVYPLYGTREVTFAELAREVGEEVGTPIGYEKTDVPTLRKLAEANGVNRPDYFWQHLTEIAKDHDAGVFSGTDEIITRVTGRAPVDVKEFIHARRDVFLGGPKPPEGRLARSKNA